MKSFKQYLTEADNQVFTKQEFIDFIAKNNNSGKWINGTFEVLNDSGHPFSIGIKANGKWIQRMQGNNKPYWSNDMGTKTVKAFKQDIETGLNYILS